MADGAVHSYRTTLTWLGTTGVGYESYTRAHQVAAEPSGRVLHLSSDPAFRGDPSMLNPEELLLAAASSCQLLSFLAVASRARLDVMAYLDEAEAVMPEDDPPIRITQITLRPQVVLADTERDRPTPERLLHLTEVAHRECFIANSLASDVVVSPTFTWVDDASTDHPEGS